MDTYKLARNYILKRRFKVIEDSEECIIFRYQLENIYICKDQQSEGSLIITLPILKDDSNVYYDVYKCCNDVNAELKYAKVYISDSWILAASEISYLGKKDLEHQMNVGLQSLVTAKARYEKKYLEKD